MKNSEIRQLTDKELSERIDNEKSSLVRMKLNHAVSPLDNPLQMRDMKKDIARLSTELNKRRRNEKK